MTVFDGAPRASALAVFDVLPSSDGVISTSNVSPAFQLLPSRRFLSVNAPSIGSGVNASVNVVSDGESVSIESFPLCDVSVMVNSNVFLDLSIDRFLASTLASVSV